jgi:phosphate-selective porin OprO/OprP
VDYGRQVNTPLPQTLRTIVAITGNQVLGVPFLSFNRNVLENGPRALWTLFAAYYYRQLTLLGEWGSGYQDYSLTGSLARTRLPVESFYVQAAYLLTGEQVASRGMVRPRRPFDLRRGKFGPGAWEVAARYSRLDLGSQVFTRGLADPNVWTNRLSTVDLGLNWYLNSYLRVLFDWQYAAFGSPVVYRPGGLQKTSDLFLIRFQIDF